MPTISTFYGIVIQMFWNDHAPPHFHALYGEHEVLLEIRTLGVMRGSFPRRALALVLEWAQEHRDELLEDWNLCAEMQTSQEDRSTAVTPTVALAAPWRVQSVEIRDDYAVYVRFSDGSAGAVYMRGLIESDGAGVFAALGDPAVFAQARVVLGAVTWPGEIDLAPDAMHTQINRHGQWLLGPTKAADT